MLWELCVSFYLEYVCKDFIVFVFISVRFGCWFLLFFFVEVQFFLVCIVCDYFIMVYVDVVGVCGYGNLYVFGYGVYIIVLFLVLFKNGMVCGVCFEVQCGGKGKFCKFGFVVVIVINFCLFNLGQSVNNGGWCNFFNEYFDFFYFVFVKIVDFKVGVVFL